MLLGIRLGMCSVAVWANALLGSFNPATAGRDPPNDPDLKACWGLTLVRPMSRPQPSRVGFNKVSFGQCIRP